MLPKESDEGDPMRIRGGAGTGHNDESEESSGSDASEEGEDRRRMEPAGGPGRREDRDRDRPGDDDDDEPMGDDDTERDGDDDDNDDFDGDEEGEESKDEEEEVAEYRDGEEEDDGEGLELDDWLHQDLGMAYGVFIPSSARGLRILCLRLHESTDISLSPADINAMVGEMWAMLKAFGLIHFFIRETHHLLVLRPVTSLASYNYLAHP
jgi:hypothetical protein